MSMGSTPMHRPQYRDSSQCTLKQGSMEGGSEHLILPWCISVSRGKPSWEHGTLKPYSHHVQRTNISSAPMQLFILIYQL